MHLYFKSAPFHRSSSIKSILSIFTASNNKLYSLSLVAFGLPPFCRYSNIGCWLLHLMSSKQSLIRCLFLSIKTLQLCFTSPLTVINKIMLMSSLSPNISEVQQHFYQLFNYCLNLNIKVALNNRLYLLNVPGQDCQNYLNKDKVLKGVVYAWGPVIGLGCQHHLLHYMQVIK